jgi:hypothetical protein
LLYGRYFGVLGSGAAPPRSRERSAYTRLRKSLSEGGKPALIYAQWLNRFLDAVDRFFGDGGMADRTLFPRAFGLKTPVPLWTAPAFDRCLLLALIYPVGTIFAIWAISGHVGPAEAALGLTPDIAGWKRGAAAALVGLSAVAGAKAFRATGWKAYLSNFVLFLCVTFIASLIFIFLDGVVNAFWSEVFVGGAVVLVLGARLYMGFARASARAFLWLMSYFWGSSFSYVDRGSVPVIGAFAVSAIVGQGGFSSSTSD